MGAKAAKEDAELLIKVSRIITSMHADARTEAEAAEEALALIADFRQKAYEAAHLNLTARLMGWAGGS